MSLPLLIAPASDVPIFRQIQQQIQRAVATGRLPVGEQLPSVRVLAEQIVVNPNTVARSYQELIRSGVLESRAGRGIFVSERRQVYSEAEQRRRLTQAAEQLCHEALLLDADLPAIQTLLESTWTNLRQAPPPDTEPDPKP